MGSSANGSLSEGSGDRLVPLEGVEFYIPRVTGCQKVLSSYLTFQEKDCRDYNFHRSELKFMEGLSLVDLIMGRG